MTNSLKEKTEEPSAIYLKDYQAPPFAIDKTDLNFELDPTCTRVTATLSLRRTSPGPLVLHGDEVKLVSVSLDGTVIDDYEATAETLTFEKLPASCTLEIQTEIAPAENTSLMGLYQSRGTYCTQCESEGFRRITYYLDRPDVLSTFTTTVIGDLPVLLSNGNCVSDTTLDDGRRKVVWEDPFPKPAYLFALVGGDLAHIEDSFTTMSGRDVTLRIFVEHGNEGRCLHAMDSLKRSMKWDEEVYGREYDLDIFMIVAVDDFNFGAMENKGLNVFNSSCVLADPATATDLEHERIDGIVAHEYFHNWSGDRVTLRDWFQLTLKEGLTVFRDQEYGADQYSRPVHRIEQVRSIRAHQFSEDAGPNAHPIRPTSYIEINNFYTTTIYQKGAEVIRMIHTLLGPDTWRKGTDLYFSRFDGQAVTTEDFLSVMEEVSAIDLTQFKNWYHQAGTPEVSVSIDYDAAQKEVRLTVRQTCRATAECQNKEPFYFPLTVGFLDHSGKELVDSKVLRISKREETFTFKGMTEKPIPSLLRNFSAPVKLTYPYTEEELIILLANDTDTFNRFDAGQRLVKECLLNKKAPSDALLNALGAVLEDGSLDPAYKAEVVTFPSEGELIEEMNPCDFDGIHSAREAMTLAFATRFEEELLRQYKATAPDTSANRRLRNRCLAFLSQLPDHKYILLIADQYRQSETMTDQLTALGLLCQTEGSEREEALASFYEQWKHDTLVMNKWFAVQSRSKLPNVLEYIKCLEKHEAYDPKNPNKVRALISVFTANLAQFHAVTGEGYTFIADKILELDSVNTHLSGRLATAFKKYATLDPVRKALAGTQLKRILETKGISKDVYEIVSKTVATES